MLNAEIEKTLKKIADTQLVHARLMETNDRKWEKRFEGLQSLAENHERRVENLEQAAEHLHRATEKLWRVAETHERRLDDGARRTATLEDQVRTTLASIDRLIKMLEDFAKGRKRENGRRK